MTRTGWGYGRTMRVVVTGATGNVGTSVVRSLISDDHVESIVAVSRRVPDLDLPKVEWSPADISVDPLKPIVEGADAVVHLAWELQPSWDDEHLRRVNIGGTRRLVDAIVASEVPRVVYASSIGAYSRGPVDQPVEESWPTTGVATSQYSRQKAAVERLLDDVESVHPQVRIVRLRKALVFKQEAAAAIKRLFLGPFAPTRLIGRFGLPIFPRDRRFTVQAVHSHDAAEAYRLALTADVDGSFNIAADPPLTPEVVAEVIGARPAPVSPRLLRAAAGAGHLLRLQPAEPGWVDLATAAPVMDTSAARRELGWQPVRSAVEALRELLAGFRMSAGTTTPRLVPGRGGATLGVLGGETTS
jgi:UDP-glucose 4-epimerase